MYANGQSLLLRTSGKKVIIYLSQVELRMLRWRNGSMLEVCNAIPDQKGNLDLVH